MPRTARHKNDLVDPLPSRPREMGNWLTGKAVRRELDIDDEELNRRVAAGEIIRDRSMMKGGRPGYPEAQFRDGDVHPLVTELLPELDGLDSFTKWCFFMEHLVSPDDDWAELAPDVDRHKLAREWRDGVLARRAAPHVPWNPTPKEWREFQKKDHRDHRMEMERLAKLAAEELRSSDLTS